MLAGNPGRSRPLQLLPPDEPGQGSGLSWLAAGFYELKKWRKDDVSRPDQTRYDEVNPTCETTRLIIAE